MTKESEASSPNIESMPSIGSINEVRGSLRLSLLANVITAGAGAFIYTKGFEGVAVLFETAAVLQLLAIGTRFRRLQS